MRALTAGGAREAAAAEEMKEQRPRKKRRGPGWPATLTSPRESGEEVKQTGHRL